MDGGFLGLLDPQAMLVTAQLIPSDLALAAVCLLATAALVAFCVPGVLMPTAIAAGALLGAWAGAALVVAGAVCGSQILFLVSRHLAGGRLHRLGDKFVGVQSSVARHGLWYVVALRVIGVPHFLVTVASASTPMRSRAFLAANAIGFFPVLCLSAIAGSALQFGPGA